MTSTDIVDAISVLARVCTDCVIVAALHRSGHKTATDRPWNAARVRSLRKSRKVSAYSQERQQEEGWLKLGEAASYLGVSQISVRNAVERGKVTGQHPVALGPWVLRRQDLTTCSPPPHTSLVSAWGATGEACLLPEHKPRCFQTGKEITQYDHALGADWQAAATDFRDYIAGETLATELQIGAASTGGGYITHEAKLGDETITVALRKADGG
jgi:hypothetical protein